MWPTADERTRARSERRNAGRLRFFVAGPPCGACGLDAALAEVNAVVVDTRKVRRKSDVRGTADIDLAAAVDPFRELGLLQRRLEAEGLIAELNLPDVDDGLGGDTRVMSTSGGSACVARHEFR
jgi:hypothetical protein